jgi:elongation factor P
VISSNDFRTGVTIELEGDIFTVVDFQHVKPGKGAAFVRTKLKNIRTGAVIERTFRAGEKMPRARIEYREMQYLYNDGETYVFMDTRSYEQLSLPKNKLEGATKYLKDNMSIYVMLHDNTAIGVELPNFVELTVAQTEPGIKGDTATGGSKQAILETGAVVQVPLFIEEGDVLKVDTRTGAYISRV